MVPAGQRHREPLGVGRVDDDGGHACPLQRSVDPVVSQEVRQHPEAFGQLRELAHKGLVTLVYSARDEEHNDAVVLRNLLLGRRRRVHAL